MLGQARFADDLVGDQPGRRAQRSTAHHLAAASNSPTVSATTPAAPSTSPVKPPSRHSLLSRQ